MRLRLLAANFYLKIQPLFLILGEQPSVFAENWAIHLPTKRVTALTLIMGKEREKDVETSILPIKYVDLVEDVFHAILAIALLVIGIGAFFFSIKRLIETAPFFPNGMIQGVNDILFIVIILEILRTVISRFTDGVYQLDKFLIIGVIAAVRHILTVGASLTLESGKTDAAFDRAIYEMGLNALIVVALVFAIFLSKNAHRNR